MREGHAVDMVLSLHLSAQESKLLNEVAKREGTDAVETVRAAIREYAAARPRPGAG